MRVPIILKTLIKIMVPIFIWEFGRKLWHNQRKAGRVEDTKRVGLIKRAKTIEDIKIICKELDFTYFLDYDSQVETKQREFLSAIDFFSLSLKDKAILDVGPGTADSLDAAKNRGAQKTFFVEEEYMFVRFAEIKGHSGIWKNYTFTPFFPKGIRNSFDLIQTKGSINCVWVDEQHELIQKGDPRGFFIFEKWVGELKALLKKGGEIILVPAMDKQTERLIDKEYDLDTFYWCPDLGAYKASFFATTLVNNGFTMHENITGFTQQKAFPIAFHFKAEDQQIII